MIKPDNEFITHQKRRHPLCAETRHFISCRWIIGNIPFYVFNFSFRKKLFRCPAVRSGGTGKHYNLFHTHIPPIKLFILRTRSSICTELSPFRQGLIRHNSAVPLMAPGIIYYKSIGNTLAFSVSTPCTATPTEVLQQFSAFITMNLDNPRALLYSFPGTSGSFVEPYYIQPFSA